MEDIKKMFERIEADGVITKEEIRQIHETIAADGTLDFDERHLLEQMVEKIKRGELKEVE